MTGRHFDPRRPWPSAAQVENRVMWMVGGVAAIQFFLAGLDHVPAHPFRVVYWWTGAAIVCAAAIRIEKYLAKRRQRGW